MAELRRQREVLVCGHPPAFRLPLILQRFGGELVLRGAHSRGELLDALAEGRHPVCIVEHQVHDFDLMKDLAKLLEGEPDDDAIIAALTSKKQPPLPQSTTAYELLPEMTSRSPATRFVITSHTRGFGFSPQQRALYKERSEVVKVIGFVNSLENTNYLLRLLSRTYLGKTWKEK